jgi:hypothetical protein
MLVDTHQQVVVKEANYTCRFAVNCKKQVISRQTVFYNITIGTSNWKEVINLPELLIRFFVVPWRWFDISIQLMDYQLCRR